MSKNDAWENPTNTSQILSAADSLQKNKADSLLLLGKSLIQAGQYDKANVVVRQSAALYNRIGLPKLVGDATYQLGVVQYQQGNFELALQYFDQGAQHYKKGNYQKGVASLINNRGAIYHYLGRYPQALEQYKKTVAMAKQLKEERLIITGLHNIGGIYLELREFKKAQHYFEECKKSCEASKDQKTLVQVLIGLGEVFLHKGNYPKALEHFQVAKALSQERNDKRSLLEVTYKMGKLYEDQHYKAKALTHFNEALQLATLLNNNVYRSRALTALGGHWLREQKMKLAKKRCLEGFGLAETLKTLPELKASCECLYQTHKVLGQSQMALTFYEKANGFENELKAKETAKMMQHMEFEKRLVRDSLAQVEKERQMKAKHDSEIAKRRKHRNYLLAAVLFVVVLSLGIYSRLVYIKKAKARLQLEKDRSEALLLNILPKKIADELKEKGYADAQYVERVAILFSDFKGFTETASQLQPQQLVEEINDCFKAFDYIMESHDLEKIKTIGDAYMAAGGLPEVDGQAVKRMVLAALEMQEFMKARKKGNNLLGRPSFDMRIGIHVGPLVAGIVGVKKFQYDVWGDTVNTASRIESNGAINKVNISQDTFELLRTDTDFVFEYRGEISAKGKGALAMYFVALKNQDVLEKALLPL